MANINSIRKFKNIKGSPCNVIACIEVTTKKFPLNDNLKNFKYISNLLEKLFQVERQILFLCIFYKLRPSSPIPKTYDQEWGKYPDFSNFVYAGINLLFNKYFF